MNDAAFVRAGASHPERCRIPFVGVVGVPVRFFSLTPEEQFFCSGINTWCQWPQALPMRLWSLLLFPWKGILLSPKPIQILISRWRYFAARGCRWLWVGLFKKTTRCDFIKGKVNLQGGFVLTPPSPLRPFSWVVVRQQPTVFLFCVWRKRFLAFSVQQQDEWISSFLKQYVK